MVDANGGLVATNALFARLCGTDLKDGALASSDLGGRVAASTAAPDRFVERARDLYMGRGDLRIDAHWYSRQVLDLRGESGENLGKLVVLRDVTELQELRARLHAEKARQP
jgi:hypothetical protein